MTHLTLSELTQAGVAVTVSDGWLRLSAPANRLTPDLRERIAANRDQLVAVLTMRDRLARLADAERLPAGMTHGLTDDDVAACAGETDATLRAYLRAVRRGHCMGRGEVPPDCTMAVHCDGCGPVWLPAGHVPRLACCPWCILRKAGRGFPVPSRARA